MNVFKHFSFKPNFLSKLSPRQDNESIFSSMSNSPTVLTERFNELFENEWSLAFKELSKIIGEKASVRHLLWIIAVCTHFAIFRDRVIPDQSRLSPIFRKLELFREFYGFNLNRKLIRFSTLLHFIEEKRLKVSVRFGQ